MESTRETSTFSPSPVLSRLTYAARMPTQQDSPPMTSAIAVPVLVGFPPYHPVVLISPLMA